MKIYSKSKSKRKRERERERERENSNRTPRSTSFFETLYFFCSPSTQKEARARPRRKKEKKIKNPKFRKKPPQKKTPPETQETWPNELLATSSKISSQGSLFPKEHLS